MKPGFDCVSKPLHKIDRARETVRDAAGNPASRECIRAVAVVELKAWSYDCLLARILLVLDWTAAQTLVADDSIDAIICDVEIAIGERVRIRLVEHDEEMIVLRGSVVVRHVVFESHGARWRSAVDLVVDSLVSSGGDDQVGPEGQDGETARSNAGLWEGA